MRSKYLGKQFPSIHSNHAWTVVAAQHIWCTRHLVFTLTDGYKFIVLWDNVMPHIAKGELSVDEALRRRTRYFKESVVLMDRKKVYFTSIV